MLPPARQEPATHGSRTRQCPALSVAWIALVTILGMLLLGDSTVARSSGMNSFLPHSAHDALALQKRTTRNAAALSTNRFDIEYVEPADPEYRPLYVLLRQEHVLEKVQALLAPVRLPIRITLKLESCGGVANATFWDDIIKVCYEYIADVMNHASKVATDTMPLRDVMIGPTIEVFLHEAGHAVVEVLDIPFFGREEDVVDYFAIYILLQLCKDDVRRLILGTSFVGGAETIAERNKTPPLHLLADTHSLPAQRYFNRWCMAYGADPILFGDAVNSGLLPQSRAKHCRYEYQTNAFAFRTLISPYIDETLRQEVFAKNWFASPAMDRPMCAATVSMAVSQQINCRALLDEGLCTLQR